MKLVRVFYPYAKMIWINISGDFEPMTQVHAARSFRVARRCFGAHALSIACRRSQRGAGGTKCTKSMIPMLFPPQISDYDLYLFNEGRLRQAYRTLGSHAVRNPWY